MHVEISLEIIVPVYESTRRSIGKVAPFLGNRLARQQKTMAAMSRE